MSGTRDDGRPDDAATAAGLPDLHASDAPPPAQPAAIAEAKPPSRRDAIIRIGIVVGVLFVVFGLILPRFIDYQQVINTLQGLTLQDYLVVTVFGVIAWVLTGAIFTMLIPGLGVLRGLQAYLILTGIGASIPLGPWNMAVLWVVIRGWGRPSAATTGGILLYGIFDQLSRFGLMFVSGLVLLIAEASQPRRVGRDRARSRRFLLLGGVLFIGLGGGLILVVRSERLARKLGQLGRARDRRGPAPAGAERSPTSKAPSSVSGSRSGTLSGRAVSAPSSSRWPRSSPGCS